MAEQFSLRESFLRPILSRLFFTLYRGSLSAYMYSHAYARLASFFCVFATADCILAAAAWRGRGGAGRAFRCECERRRATRRKLCGIDGRAELVGAADVLGMSGVVCRQDTRGGGGDRYMVTVMKSVNFTFHTVNFTYVK